MTGTHTKHLQPICHAETAQMKLPGQKTSTTGTCMSQVGPRSYEVKVRDSVLLAQQPSTGPFQ